MEKVRATCRAVAAGRSPVVAVLGLAFKPDIDDLRNSPALAITRTLLSFDDILCRVVEPNIASHPDISLTPYSEAVSNADVIVCLVAHKAFAGLRGRNPNAKVLNFCNLRIDPLQGAQS